MPVHHGIKNTEILTGARALVTAATAVIGLIAVSTDADAVTFPAGSPVLITNVRTAIEDAGTNGTLAKALTDIAEICSPQIVVVRVAASTDIDDAIVALETAQAITGVKPRILGIPGYDTQTNTALLVATAKKLRAMVYASCDVADTVSEAVTYRGEFGDRELMLIYNDFTGWSGKSIAKALGMRAYLDQTIGWHTSLSNKTVPGVTGIVRPVSWSMSGEGTDAATLNAAPVTCIIRDDGLKYWGNRTCSDEPLFAFEVAVRTNFVIQDTIDEGLKWAIDKPMTAALIKDIVETINTKFRSLIAQGFIIGGSCWFDADLNNATDLAGGKLVLDYDFTPCAPLESLNLNSRITDRYYATLAAQLS